MNLKVGIVGLPNVGKSTLFNALLKRQVALAANYPFATIEPNVGVVEVPDERLAKLAEVVETGEHLEKGSVPLKPATIEFYDIAGLVAGASQGEGLGNQFLTHIRETDLICHVLRAFEDSDVVVTGHLEPLEDLKTVRTELMLKDLESIEKQVDKARKQKETARVAVMEKVIKALNDGVMVNTLVFNDEEKVILDSLFLLTAKPEIFVVNVSEDQMTAIVRGKNPLADSLTPLTGGITDPNGDTIYISAKIESELSDLSVEDQKAYLKDLGLEQSGIEQMAKVAYEKLGLLSFLTVGEIEARAWTITKGSAAPKAAGVIHTDFEKKFIKAQVVDYPVFIELGGWKNARDKGKVRQEGRDYVMRDGDVVEFMIGK